MKKLLMLLALVGATSMVRAQTTDPKIAIFVKNQTKVSGMDDMVDGVRDRIAAELAGAGMIVLDQTDIASGFARYKVTTDEEKKGLINGVFTGGATVRVAQMLGADYVMTAAIISADRASLTVSGKKMNSYALRMTVKVCEAGKGSTVYGDNWSGKYPVTADNAADTDTSFFYNELLDQWVNNAGPKLAESSKSWRKAATPAELVSFSVTTTIDELIKGLESGVRAPNELLDEMRRIVGGVTVEIDGATVGSSPGTFQTAPGLHQLRVSRQWMKDWQQTVNIQNGSAFSIALELSDSGLQKFQSLERMRAQVANDYAAAMATKGVKINYDTSAWRDVSMSIGNRGNEVNLEKNELRQEGMVNALGNANGETSLGKNELRQEGMINAVGQ